MAEQRKKFMDMKVVELRQELDKLGLDKNGVKMVLVERLLKHVESTKDNLDNSSNGNAEGKKEVAPEGGATENKDTQGEGLVIDEVLEPNDDAGMVVDDVQNNEDQLEEETEEMHTNQEDVEGEGEENGEAEEEEEEENINEMEEEDHKEEHLDHTEGDVEHENEEEELEGDADALNISVGDNDKLEIDEDGKPGNAEESADERKDAVEDGSGADQDHQDLDADTRNNTSTSISNNADQDSKANEGETEEGSKKETTERHIILVTGLSSDTSANDLKTLFRKHGKIGRIKIMTNTRIPGSQRFAHISVISLDDLNFLVETLNGADLKGKSIRVSKAPEDGSISRSYEIAVAAAQAEAGEQNDKSGGVAKSSDLQDSTGESKKEDGGETDGVGNDIQVIQDAPAPEKSEEKDQDGEKKVDSPEKKKEEKKEQKDGGVGKKEGMKKDGRPERGPNRPRKPPHERPRGADIIRHPRNFRRDKDVAEGWKRHAHGPGRMEITRVHRDRVPINRMQPGAYHHHQAHEGGRRRSPHAPKLTFEQIRDIRDEHRKRDIERRKREEERERAVEVERQKRLEYQNYMEFKQLEREREKLRMERERIEREKLDLIRLERERQKAEREKIEREKEELRRAKLNIEQQHSHRTLPLKRPYEEEKERRRDSAERKKPYAIEGDRRGVRPEAKTEAERKVERERYERERLHAAHSTERRSRSPGTGGIRESRRDVWARDERVVRKERNRSDERSHRRETVAETVKASDRRAREAPSRAVAGSSEVVSRYPMDSHSSSRAATSSKRPSDRYEETTTRATGREDQWLQRSYLTAGSSLSLPLSSSTSAGRDSWPLADRKIEAWDTARLPARADQWISGAGATLGASGRSSLPVMAPPPPIYSHPTGLPLPGSGLSLGSYTSDRYDSYKQGFHHLRRF